MAEQEQATGAAPGWANLGQATAAAVGVALSIYLLRVHVIAHYTTQEVGGLCNLSSRVNCTAAAGSAYSELLGVPIAALGLGFYLAVLGASVFWQLRPQQARRVPEALVALHLLACGYSVFLAAISGLVVGALCWACTSLYAVNIAGLVLAKVSSRQGWGASLRGLYADLIPATFGATGLVMGLTFAVGAVGGTAGAELIGASLQVTDPAAQAAEGAAFVKGEWSKAEAVSPEVWSAMQAGPILGSTSAPVTVVAFSDFECPFCGKVAPDLRALAEESDGKIRVIFRHYPLDQACNAKLTKPFHAHACEGARAGLCAQAQGQFWPMHDALFAHPRALKASQTPGYASELGLDVQAFEACLSDPKTEQALQAELALGRQAGVRGTPALFINGRALTGAKPLWILRAITAHEAKLNGGPGELPPAAGGSHP